MRRVLRAMYAFLLFAIGPLRFPMATHGESAWRRAWIGLEQFRSSFIGFWIVEVLAASLGGIIAVWRLASTRSSLLTQTFYVGIGAVVGLGVAFVGIYAFNLMLAPYRQRNEAREEVTNLQRYEIKRRECERKISRLSGQSECGRFIRDEIRASGTIWLPRFEKAARDWETNTHAILKEEVPGEAEQFMVDYVPGGQQYQPDAHPEVANWGNFMDRRLAALAEIIRKLSQDRSAFDTAGSQPQ
jgi:hypothetical protein